MHNQGTCLLRGGLETGQLLASQQGGKILMAVLIKALLVAQRKIRNLQVWASPNKYPHLTTISTAASSFITGERFLSWICSLTVNTNRSTSESASAWSWCSDTWPNINTSLSLIWAKSLRPSLVVVSCSLMAARQSEHSWATGSTLRSGQGICMLLPC